MGRMNSKRSIAISVKVSAEDFTLMKRAAEKMWRDAPVTKSTLLARLAIIGAEAVLHRPEKK
jgi:hypothetical protein